MIHKPTRWRNLLAFVLILTLAATVCKSAYASETQTDGTQADDTQLTSETETQPAATQEPDSQPKDTQKPSTSKPVKKNKTSGTPDQVDKQCIVLSRPTLTCTERTASKVHLKWKKVSSTIRYYIYRSSKKNGKYKKIGSTTKLTYTDKTVKAKRTYYYKIYASGRNKKNMRVVSKFSKRLKVTTKAKVKRTAYVGDSVMSGMAVYKIIQESGKKVIYKVGVSPYNFYNGTPMDELLAYKPDRMYIMLGMNCLVGSPSGGQMDSQISCYRKIIQECLKNNPGMQVIVLPVSPTRPTATVHNSNIRKFNRKLKSMAKSLKVHYYDYTDCLKNTDGTLRQDYSAGDGIHLTPTAYRNMKQKLDSYGKTLD